MLPTIGAATGSLLGQMGEIMGAPRRALWSALGMPEDGAHLLSETFGMDPDSMLTKGLGVGAEVALDPLTYLGMPLGSALGKLGMRGGVAAGEIEGLTAARRAAQEAMVERAALEEATAATQAGRMAALSEIGNPGGLMAGEQASFAKAKPAAIGHLEETGLGTGAGPKTGRGEGAEVFGGSFKGQNARKTGPDHAGRLDFNAGRAGVEGPAERLGQLSPYERYLLLKQGAAGADVEGGLAAVAGQRAGELNSARAMPSLAEAMGQAAMPTGAIDTIGKMGVADLPIDAGFERVQALLADALARQKAARLTDLEKAAIGGAGAGAFGAGLGSYLGDR
jgi:hypothetical protein